MLTLPTLASPPSAISATGTNAVLCDVDVASAPDPVLAVAAEWARRCGGPLRVAHTVGLPAGLIGHARAARWVVARRKRALRSVVSVWRGRGLSVAESVRSGRVDAHLRQLAAEVEARLIVVQPARAQRRWGGLGGSVAWRLIEGAQTPTLVPRDPAVLLAWLRGRRRLRIFVGFDFSPATEAALRWVGLVAALGPIDVVLGGVCAPWAPPGRLAVGARPECEWRAHAHQLLGRPADCRIEPKRGRTASQWLKMAEQERADLIAIGVPALRGFRRAWRGSVARGVVEGAVLNTVCVPPSFQPP